jgi:hypothetical protein
MTWWQYTLTFYLAIFAIVFFRVSILVNRKRAELRATRGLLKDNDGNPITYARFLPTILAAAARWPATVLWDGLYAFLRELM